MLHVKRLLFAGFLALVPLGCGKPGGDQAARVTYPFNLTADELGLARALAEREWASDSPPSSHKTVFIKVDLLPDSQAETSQRLVMVHHYRYQDDQTIFTMIDLRTHEILKREIAIHYPTALAPSEVDQAIQLASADGRLKPLLDLVQTHFDARPIQYANPHDPLFGHRVVHLLMRQNGDYLMYPRVLVDLTNDSVHLETKQSSHQDLTK